MLTWTQTVVANAAVTDSVAASQTPAGAGALTLTATTVTFGSGSAQRITITSLSNISNRTFTIVGTAPDGSALTVSNFTGPNGTTVTTAVAFKSVTSITISGAAAGALSVGNSATAESVMYVADMDSNPFSIGFGCSISGTPTYTVQHTFDDVLATSAGPGATAGTAYNYGSSSNTWFNHAVVAAQTANDDGNYAFPVRAIRLIVTAAGTVTIKLLQGGMGVR